SLYGQLLAMSQSKSPLPSEVEDLVVPPRAGGGGKGLGVDALPPAAMICSCHNVDKATICGAIAAESLTAVGGIKACTKAGTGCGSCVPLLGEILKVELKRAGVAVNNYLCEHFPHTRQELFHLVRVKGHRTFEAVLAGHGKGRGCEICKPAL